MKPNLKLPDLVMPGEKPKTPQKQHQAEFGSPGAYFAEKTVRAVTAGGRTREAANARTLAAIEKRYGVPGEVLLAIWGRETGFGAAKMPYDAFEVLGTKAFMSTKKDFFRTEVLAALEIVERGLAPVGAMKSSWAGALGQPQFMPTSFLKHAVDFDGDGRARHLEFDPGRAGLDRQLSRPLWLGEGPRLGFRGDGAGKRLLLARRTRPGQEDLRMGGDGHQARRRQSRFRQAN